MVVVVVVVVVVCQLFITTVLMDSSWVCPFLCKGLVAVSLMIKFVLHADNVGL